LRREKERERSFAARGRAALSERNNKSLGGARPVCRVRGATRHAHTRVGLILCGSASSARKKRSDVARVSAADPQRKQRDVRATLSSPLFFFFFFARHNGHRDPRPHAPTILLTCTHPHSFTFAGPPPARSPRPPAATEPSPPEPAGPSGRRAPASPAPEDAARAARAKAWRKTLAKTPWSKLMLELSAFTAKVKRGARGA
jgi:hypothetical protein